MDKKLSRTIGYRPDKAKSKEAPPAAPPRAAKEVRQDPKKSEITAQQVVDWINSHPLFKWTTMCSQVGIDSGNFSRVLQVPNPVISPENLLKIAKVLADYGFVSKSG